jgi:SAM-dependent methyltransferase
MARLPIPPALKRRLVPLWNEVHRLGWLARDYLSATLLGRWRRCVVCGRFRPMLYRRRVIPPRLTELWGLSTRLVRALARKESSDCAGCGAKLRARRLARVILEFYPVGDPPAPARALGDWARTESARRLKIAEINRIEGLHEQLVALPGFQSSDYQPGAPAGAAVDGVRSEDLSRLTYSDASLDLVLTSETLEHVPDLQQALREIHRVLVPGGRHVCTVPILPGVAKTFARASILPDGRLEQLAPPICHPGGDVGYPVFTELGLDFPEIVAAAGFDVGVRFGPVRVDDLAQVYVWTKRASAR